MGLDFGSGLADGTYAVRLFMGNGYDPTGTPGKRVFDVMIEGDLAFDNVDIAARFGHETGGMLECAGPSPTAGSTSTSDTGSRIR